MLFIHEDDLVSIVVRTTGKRNISFLNEAIESIASNRYRPIEVVVVAQTEDKDFVKAIGELTAIYQFSDFLISIIINQTSQDQRTRNLNLGIDQARGRYIGFLDDDDIFYENHIEALITPLKEIECFSWSYGNIALALCSTDGSNRIVNKNYDAPFGRDFDLDTLFQGNFIPIHAYLIDRNRINQDLLIFDEKFELAEDYAFLLRLAVNYRPYYVRELVGEYRIFRDFSNSNLIINELLKIPDRSKVKSWSKALWQIEVLKEHLLSSYSSGLFSQKFRKYIFYLFPGIKIFFQYRFSTLRHFLVNFIRIFGLME